MNPSPGQRLLPNAAPAGLLLLAGIVLLVAAMQPEGSRVAGALVTAGVALILVSAFGGWPVAGLRRSHFGPVWIAALVGAGFLIPAAGGLAETGVHYSLSVAVFGGVALWLQWKQHPLTTSWQWVTLGLATTVLVVISIAVVIDLPAPAIDVLFANQAGADALAQGDNPYAVAQFTNTSPIVGEEATFTGYVYPPVALFLYSASDWLFGDTRWVNILAVAVFLALLLRPWAEKDEGTTVIAAAGVVGFALIPDLAFLLRHGWTEPIAFPFLAGSVLLWRRRPVAAALLLGLAVASKQYFVLLAPLLLLWNDEFRWRRVAIVGGVVVGTMAPFVALDPGAFWDAVIAPSFDAGIRPDSINLIPLGLEPPSWLAGVLAVAIAIPLGRRAGDGSEFALASAAVLSVAFLFGFQAFANYWLLVVALCVLAAVAAATPQVGTRAVRSQVHPTTAGP